MYVNIFFLLELLTNGTDCQLRYSCNTVETFTRKKELDCHLKIGDMYKLVPLSPTTHFLVGGSLS